MRKLFMELGVAVRAGQSAVLATVIAASGSVPRGMGARMAVTEKGRLCGTIGGGAVEHRAIQTALEVLQAQSPRAELYRLHENEVQDLGMICGGEVRVFFRYIPGGEAGFLDVCDEIEAAYTRGGAAWLVEEIAPAGAMKLFGQDDGLPEGVKAALNGYCVLLQPDDREIFCEKLVRPGVVYIFGGGHVSQALVPVLASVGFRCVVLEDRPDFAEPGLFPGVEKTLLIDNANIGAAVTITADDYVAVMTRGHKDDRAVQAQVLKTPARYIGVIGSRRKTAGVFAWLRGHGFTGADLARVTTPIGLDIGAETPAEIAVSIAAQMIQIRAKGSR